MSAVPEASARPTGRREGARIGPVRASCPYCGSDGATDRRVNLCGGCGRWFEVEER